jgi:cytochrome c
MAGKTATPMRTTLLLPSVFLLLGVAALSGAADLERGRLLFADPALGGSTWGKNCLTCHAGGEGLGKDFQLKEQFAIMGLQQAGLAEAIDFCIQVTMRGEGLDPDSRDLADLSSFLRSIHEGSE